MLELNMSFDVKSHLIDRHVDLELHRPAIADLGATFMLYNFSGKIVGYQIYSPLNEKLCSNNPNGRYFTYRSNDEICVFGLETYKPDATVFLTEGIFDAVRLTKHGCTAFALLTNSPNSSMLNFISILPNKIVAITDNDEGGRFFEKKIRHVANHIVPCMDFKDLGDSPESFVKQIITKFY